MSHLPFPAIARSSLSFVVAIGALGTAAASVAADCGMTAPSRRMSAYLGDAFAGTITRLERNGPGEIDWTITIDVDEVIRGDSPDPFVISDYGGACGSMEPQNLVEGATILMSVTQRRGAGPAPELGDYPLLWRRVDGGWRLWLAAMGNADSGGRYPAAAVAATTRSQILRLVAEHAYPPLPPTDGEAVPPTGSPLSQLPLLALMALVGALSWSWRRREMSLGRERGGLASR